MAAPALAPILAYIFQESIDQGTTPRQWREATITPIYKKGDKSQPVNYCQISIPYQYHQQTYRTYHPFSDYGPFWRSSDHHQQAAWLPCETFHRNATYTCHPWYFICIRRGEYCPVSDIRLRKGVWQISTWTPSQQDALLWHPRTTAKLDEREEANMW